MRIERFLDDLAAAALEQCHGQAAPGLIKVTTDPRHGDYQCNAAMPMAKRLGRPPREIAAPVAVALAEHPAVATAEVAGPGFINLRLDDNWVAKQLDDALGQPDRLGVEAVTTPQKVVVDFSSPNIAKQMHVGHLRSTIIGAALVRILRYVGHDVIGDNHLGDWGTQFGLLIIGMRDFGDEAALERDPVAELERIYQAAQAAAKDDPEVAGRARAELAKLQSGDAENLALWRRFVAATRRNLDQVYERLDVTFDQWLGESAYHDMLPNVVEQLCEQGIAREDDGALCVFFSELDGAPDELKQHKAPFIVRKKDGAFLYSTTDIATILHRRDHFATERAIYVVDSRQGLHFKQLFAVAKRLGVEMELEHVGFGMVLGADGKPLRTRDGKNVTLNSLLDEAIERASARIREEGLQVDAEAMAQVANAVGIGAVIYADLRQNRASDYQFDWDKMISFKGNAGPYLQYAYARIQSMFRKGGIDPRQAGGRISLAAPAEVMLGRQLLRFGEVVHQASETCYPHLITDHLYGLARAFSAFYESCPVLKAEGPTRESRLALSALAALQLERGLGLLGIKAIDRM